MTDAEQKYADIIHLTRPEPEEILRKYPRQPMSERAKIFSPFAALRGHEERLSEEDDRLTLVEQAELSEEDTRALGEKINRLEKGRKITATWFEPEEEAQGLGRYVTVTGTVLEVDPALGRLRLKVQEEDGAAGERKLAFAALAGLEIRDA